MRPTNAHRCAALFLAAVLIGQQPCAASYYLAPKSAGVDKANALARLKVRLGDYKETYGGRNWNQPKKQALEPIEAVAREYWPGSRFEIRVDTRNKALVLEPKNKGERHAAVLITPWPPDPKLDAAVLGGVLEGDPDIVVSDPYCVRGYVVIPKAKATASTARPKPTAQVMPLSPQEQAAVAFLEEHSAFLAPLTQNKTLQRESSAVIRATFWKEARALLAGTTIVIGTNPVAIDEAVVSGLEQLIFHRPARDIEKVAGCKRDELLTFAFALVSWSRLRFATENPGMATDVQVQEALAQHPEIYRRRVVGLMMRHLPVIHRARNLPWDRMPVLDVALDSDSQTTPPKLRYEIKLYEERPDIYGTPSILLDEPFKSPPSEEKINVAVTPKESTDLKRMIEESEHTLRTVGHELDILGNPQQYSKADRVMAARLPSAKIPRDHIPKLIDILVREQSSDVRHRLLISIINLSHEYENPTPAELQSYRQMDRLLRNQQGTLSSEDQKDLLVFLSAMDRLGVLSDFVDWTLEEKDFRKRIWCAALVINYVMDGTDPTEEMMEEYARLESMFTQKSSATLEEAKAKVAMIDLLKRIHHPHTQKFFALLVEHPHPAVCSAAIEELKQYPDAVTAEALAKASTKNPEPRIREEALDALQKILGTPTLSIAETQDMLGALLGSDNASLHSLAIDRLLQMPNEKSLDMLASVEDNPHPHIKKKALEAMQELMKSPALSEFRFSPWLRKTMDYWLVDYKEGQKVPLAAYGDWIVPLADILAQVGDSGTLKAIATAQKAIPPEQTSWLYALTAAQTRILERRQPADRLVELVEDLKKKQPSEMRDTDVSELLALSTSADFIFLRPTYVRFVQRLVNRIADSKEEPRVHSLWADPLKNLQELLALKATQPTLHAFYDSRRLQRLEQALRETGVSEDSIMALVGVLLEFKGPARYEDGEIFTDAELLKLENTISRLTGEPEKRFGQLVREMLYHELVHERLQTADGWEMIKRVVLENPRWTQIFTQMKIAFPQIAGLHKDSIATETVAKVFSLLFEGPNATSVLRPELRQELLGLRQALESEHVFQEITGGIEAQGDASKQKVAYAALKAVLGRAGRVSVRPMKEEKDKVKLRLDGILSQIEKEREAFLRRLAVSRDPIAMIPAAPLFEQAA